VLGQMQRAGGPAAASEPGSPPRSVRSRESCPCWQIAVIAALSLLAFPAGGVTGVPAEPGPFVLALQRMKCAGGELPGCSTA